MSPTQAPPSLGLAALALARAELARGVAEEPPGSNDSERIRVYRAPCVRRGAPLRLGPSRWCAMFASFCAWEAWTGGFEPDLLRVCLSWSPERHAGSDAPPIGYRAAVTELRDDAYATGALRLPQAAEEPLPGDLLVWEHHVGICSEWGAAKQAICGNDGDRVAEVTLGPDGEHPRAGPLLAWIRLG